MWEGEPLISDVVARLFNTRCTSFMDSRMQHECRTCVAEAIRLHVKAVREWEGW
jgi:hypothetical protein